MKNKISPEPFQWKDEYNVDISIIDEQHKKFLEIINQLKVVISQDECKDTVSDIFYQLAYLIDHYFIQEEIYFKDCQYPHFDKHKSDHNEFINRIIKFQKDLEKDKPDLCLEIYHYLEQWFDDHILKFDKEAVTFLKNKGVN